MKNSLLFFAFLLVSLTSSSQLRRSYLNQLAPYATYKYNVDLWNGSDTTSIHTFGIGISLAQGDIDVTSDWNGVPITTQWNYAAVPFIGMEYNLASTKGQSPLYKANDGASPLMISFGATGGIGGSFLIFPLGINGTIGASTDFKDAYVKYGLAYDMWGLSLGISGFWNLSNSNKSYYKTTPGLEIRYIWNWD